MKHTCIGVACVIFVFIIVLCSHRPAAAGDWFYEIGLGAGTSINSQLDTRQVMIVPAAGLRLTDDGNIQLRLEGNLEGIYHDGKVALLAGIAPMLRLFLLPGEDRGPYVEGGAGANYISRDSIGRRDLGGSFIFSLIAGAGYVFSAEEKRWSLGIRFKHISNAGLYAPNEGLDALYVLVSVAF